MCHVTQAAFVRNQDGYQLGMYLGAGAHILWLQIRYNWQDVEARELICHAQSFVVVLDNVI